MIACILSFVFVVIVMNLHKSPSSSVMYGQGEVHNSALLPGVIFQARICPIFSLLQIATSVFLKGFALANV